MARRSSRLARLAASDSRIESYEFDDNDNGSHWLHLADGFIDSESGCSSIHQATVRGVIESLEEVINEKEDR